MSIEECLLQLAAFQYVREFFPAGFRQRVRAGQGHAAAKDHDVRLSSNADLLSIQRSFWEQVDGVAGLGTSDGCLCDPEGL